MSEMESPYAKSTKVPCKKHGWRPSLVFEEVGYKPTRVCFTCFKEKNTKGLYNFDKKLPESK